MSLSDEQSPRWRRPFMLTVGVVALAGAVVAAITAVAGSPGTAPLAADVTESSAPRSTGRTDVGPQTPPTPTVNGQAQPASPAAPSPSRSGVVTTEVLPGATPTQDSLPGLTSSGSSQEAAGPSLTGPLPANASARGAVVAGFPTAVVPIVDGLAVVSSSVSSEGNRLQVGLEASSHAEPATVQAQYTEALTGAGFAAVAATSVPGTRGTSYTRGSDGLVLTVAARIGGGTELSVVGTLSTSG